VTEATALINRAVGPAVTEIVAGAARGGGLADPGPGSAV
jgi:hypothetical protein